MILLLVSGVIPLIFFFGFSWNSACSLESLLYLLCLLPACFTTHLLLCCCSLFGCVCLNKCHFCYHRCVHSVPDPGVLAPAASPHGRAGSSYTMASPPEKDPLIAIQVSLNQGRCSAPSAHDTNWKSKRSEREKTDNKDK